MHPDREFRDVFEDEHARVVRTVYLVLGDQGRAEEITQDAFLQMLRHWRRVRDYEYPGAWVRRVAVRMAIKSAQRERRLASALAAVRPEPIEVGQPEAFDPQVRTAVAHLSPRQRAVVVLFYFEDLPVEQIAPLLECSESTVRVHLHRARLRLAQLLGEEVTSNAD